MMVAWRRARSGPLRPSWSFGFEALVAALRLHTRWLAQLDIAALRRAAEGMRGMLAPGVSVKTDRVGSVSVTWFEPNTTSKRTVLYLHGGGYVFGSASQDRGIASRLAVALDARVVAPDYRLAPEAPFPAAVDDVEAILTELLHAGSSNVTLVGPSAGAGIALSAITRLRANGAALPARLVLLSPVVDMTCSSASWSANEGVDWGFRSALVHWVKLYAGSRDPAAPEISAVHADLAGLPPTLVVNGDAELLADDARNFVERARRAGVEIVHHAEPDMIHAFMTLGRNDEATKRTFDQIRRFGGAAEASAQLGLA